MLSRQRKAIFAVLTLAALACTLAGVSLARSGNTPVTPPGLDRISNPGVVSALTVDEALDASRSGVAEMRNLGRFDGVGFFVGRAADGSVGRCFAISLDRGSGLAAVGCQQPGPIAFPSAATPILDMSVYQADTGMTYPHVERIEGFAADGISTVEFIGEGGNVTEVPVHDNVYATKSVPAEGIVKIVGLTPTRSVAKTIDLPTLS